MELDEDHEIIKLSDELETMGQEAIYTALGGNMGDQWEEISFNVLEYGNLMQQNGIAFMFYRICKHNDFYLKFNFSHELCYKMCLELTKGYQQGPQGNAYHNELHIIDSL